MSRPKESKNCLGCQKPFSNRKSWKMRDQWQEVLYCSDRCRKEKKVK